MRPLEEGYQTVEVHVTQLEQYYACPYKHHCEPKQRNSEALEFGTFTHNIILPFLMKKTGEYEHDMLLKRTMLDLACIVNYKRCSQLSKYIDLIRDKYKDKQFYFIEFGMTLEVHLWKFKIIIKWTIDAIYKEAGKYFVVDLKTAKNVWKQEMYKTKIQKYFYPWMLDQYVPWEVIGCEYAILTKHKLPKNIKLQTVWIDFDNQTISQFCEDLLYLYAESLETWVRPADVGDACRYCQLGPKKTKKCPIYMKKDF